tara:strand:- start:441 stop:743 length:303 start_codon:yes stop_codon:yes gene_type:complete
MKTLPALLLLIPSLLFANDWNMENLIGTLQGCANDEKEFFDVLSNGEILEYCACTTKMTANLLTENDIIELYEKNQLADKMSELNEKHQINKICTEKLFK